MVMRSMGFKLLIGILAICLMVVGCQGNQEGKPLTMDGASQEQTQAGDKIAAEEKTEAQKEATQESGTPLAKDKGEHRYENPDLGFSFEYNKLMLDTEYDDDTFATLMHLSGDKAYVTVAVPDEMLEDPEAWLKKEGTTKDYKTFQDKVMTLDGYPARLNEYEISMMGTLYRTINLTALKDGYFYTLSVLMNAAYVEDTRTEFDVVVATFGLSDKKVDLEQVAPWKSEVPADFPLETVPFFQVESIYGVFGKTMAAGGRIDVTYIVKEGFTEEDALKFYDDTLKGTEGYSRYDVHEGQEITGTLGPYAIEVTVKKFLDVQVSVNVRKK